MHRIHTRAAHFEYQSNHSDLLHRDIYDGIAGLIMVWRLPSADGRDIDNDAEMLRRSGWICGKCVVYERNRILDVFCIDHYVEPARNTVVGNRLLNRS